MSVGRLIGWGFVALFALTPVNWFRLWATNQIPAGNSVGGLLIGTMVAWGIAGAGGYLLLQAAKKSKARALREQEELQALLAAPLAEVKPQRALLKAGEKAYAVASASLQEMKTVGYQAGTTGVSVRVAKGVTLRTSGTRGKAVKGMVAVANGELVLTDRRILFAGDSKSFAMDLDDLLSATSYNDGFGFGGSRATYTVAVPESRQRFAFQVALDKTLAATREVA